MSYRDKCKHEAAEPLPIPGEVSREEYEAKAIDLAERIVRARQRVAHAEYMLGVCSEFAAKNWEEALADSREFLADLEKNATVLAVGGW